MVFHDSTTNEQKQSYSEVWFLSPFVVNLWHRRNEIKQVFTQSIIIVIKGEGMLISLKYSKNSSYIILVTLMWKRIRMQEELW